MWGEGGKPSKPKQFHSSRTTMNEMKRRVAGILEFIGRTQVEMAGENSKSDGAGRSPNSGNGRIEGNVQSLNSNGVNSVDDDSSGGSGAGEVSQQQALMKGLMDGFGGVSADDGVGEKEFARLSSGEMMKVLTRRLLKWQKEFGKYGEK